MGHYIVFEGIDGCGKTTQINELRKKLLALDKDVIRLREPTTESPYGKILHDIFENGKSFSDTLELFENDRRWHMDFRVKHALLLNVFILQDRSYFSTAAYQSIIENFTYDQLIRKSERFSFIPEIVFLFDLDVDVALSRVSNRTKKETSIEKKDKQELIRQQYLKIYDEYGEQRNIQLIDASKAEYEITNELMKILKITGLI